MRKTILIVIDGCAPDYLTPETAPNLHRIIQEGKGFYKTVQGAVPTVTNVNHAAILSGQPPCQTMVTGNYYYDRDKDIQDFIESDHHMKAPVIFTKFRREGKKTALLTVKGKVLKVFGTDADIKLSAQTPDPGLLNKLGLTPPPSIQTPEANVWIMEAAYRCVQLEDPDFLYCTTNDFPMHHYMPSAKESLDHIAALDQWIGRLHSLDPQRAIYVTADHGMNQKTDLADMTRILDRKGFHVVCIPPLKDRYIENHLYQEGGILFLYLKDGSEAKKLVEYLESLPSVENVLPAEDAAKRYELPEDGIGDYVIFAAPGYAFGELEQETLHTEQVRTHGSLYERTVPLFAVNPSAPEDAYGYSRDIVPNLAGSFGR